MSELLESNQLKTELEHLMLICESPRFYLAEFFSHLKADVDIQMARQEFCVHQQTNEQKREVMKQIYFNIIQEIESFEKKCIKSKYNMQSAMQRLQSIEAVLNNKESDKSYMEIKSQLETEEYLLLKELFQNQTIAFVDVNHLNDNKINQLLNNKLVIVNDEFIRPKIIKER